MKICIYGAGAIGGYLGVQLARAGAEVSLVARGPHLAAMRENGLKLLIDGEERVAQLRCTDDPRELGPQDYVIIALKAHSVPSVLDAMQPLLGPDTAVVTAVNGIPYWYFYKHGGALEGTTLESIDPGGRQWRELGPERAIGCVVYPATEVVAPGVIQHVYGTKFPLGEASGERTERVEKLSQMMAAGGLDAPIRDNIRDEIWLKLWGNLCFNPISALTHGTLDIIATTTTAKAGMGDAIAVPKGADLHVAVRTRALQGCATAVTLDGKTLPAYARTLPADGEAAFDWRSDGKPHWLRVDIRSADGKLLILGNPVYVNR